MNKYFIPVRYALIALLAVLSPTGTLQAQGTYHGSLDTYRKAIRNALEQYYQLALECAFEPEERALMIQSVETTYLMPGGAYVPDLMKYDNKDMVLSYSNYVSKLGEKYHSVLSGESEYEVKQGNISLGHAEWTDDGNGILIQAQYENELWINKNLIYKGKSLAVVCFPVLQNLVDYRFKQVTPYPWNPNATPPAVNELVLDNRSPEVLTEALAKLQAGELTYESIRTDFTKDAVVIYSVAQMKETHLPSRNTDKRPVVHRFINCPIAKLESNKQIPTIGKNEYHVSHTITIEGKYTKIYLKR